MKSASEYAIDRIRAMAPPTGDARRAMMDERLSPMAAQMTVPNDPYLGAIDNYLQGLSGQGEGSGWFGMNTIPQEMARLQGVSDEYGGLSPEYLQAFGDSALMPGPGVMAGTVGRFYHATDKAFDQFDLARAGTGADFGAPRDAVFLTDDPLNVADGYLGGGYVNRATAGEPTRDIGNGVGRWYSEGGNIRPVDVQDIEKFEVWDMAGADWGHSAVNKAINEAKRLGAPGVLLENVRDPGITTTGAGTPSTVAVVFSADNLRSPFAPVDPNQLQLFPMYGDFADPNAVGRGLLSPEAGQ